MLLPALSSDLRTRWYPFPPPVQSGAWFQIKIHRVNIIERDFCADVPAAEVQIKAARCLPVQLAEINLAEEGSAWLSFPFHTWFQKQNQSSRASDSPSAAFTRPEASSLFRRKTLLLRRSVAGSLRFDSFNRNHFRMKNKQMHQCGDCWGRVNRHFRATTCSSVSDSHQGGKKKKKPRKRGNSDFLRNTSSLHFSRWNGKLQLVAISIRPKLRRRELKSSIRRSHNICRRDYCTETDDALNCLSLCAASQAPWLRWFLRFLGWKKEEVICSQVGSNHGDQDTSGENQPLLKCKK